MSKQVIIEPAVKKIQVNVVVTYCIELDPAEVRADYGDANVETLLAAAKDMTPQSNHIGGYISAEIVDRWEEKPARYATKAGSK